MKSLRINQGHLHSRILLPASKSYANRALILCSIMESSPVLRNLPEASDVMILINCLKEVGVDITRKNDSLNFNNTFPECENGPKTLSVGEGGTTARFLAAMLLLGNSEYELVLGDRLKDRPWQEFIDIVRSLGGKAALSSNVLTLQGPLLFPEELNIDCSKTTQFASAFQLLSMVKKIKVIPVNMKSSQSYWRMTEKLIREMFSKTHYEIPIDWSSASYPIAFAALNQTISFPGLREDSFQADSKFYELLQSFDCIEQNNEEIIVSPIRKHRSVSLDVSDCLDLVPTLAFFLSHIEGQHVLFGVKNLVHKESDRLTEVMGLLKNFDRKVSTDENSLHIKGTTCRLKDPKRLIMPNDHRMVMVGSLFLLHHGGGEIGPVEAVAKSYPDFFKIFKS